jgi:3-hydroxy-3-methylglutaryl CoA synthase/uncharacterized OB-fold protein
MLPATKARGSRAFCSWDEDAVTMAVEAARAALQGRSDPIDAIAVASTTMPNADLQHSAIIATTLDLPRNIRTADYGFSQRAGTSALCAALRAEGASALVIASDCPLAKPASSQELVYGAGAAALTVGTTGVIAELVATGSVASPLVDHFRQTGADFDYVWEERWVREEGYSKLAPAAISAALQEAGLDIRDIRYFALSSPLAGVAALVAKKLGFDGVVMDPLREGCGYAGVADPLLALIGMLEAAAPGDPILLLGFGQGCDALILRATPALAAYRSSGGLARALADGFDTDSYLRMLSFQGLFDPDWGMRGEKEVRTALTDQFRSVDQIWKFDAGKCSVCGTVQFPQLAYCVSCQAPANKFATVSLAQEKGRVLTYTADWLTYHPAPPLYAGFVQFEQSTRLLMEIVDVGPQGISEGTSVHMVFRVKDRDLRRGWKRYFWKAAPDPVGRKVS